MDKDSKKKAQTGDIKAIEQIVNRSLGFKNIKAKVERHDHHLHIFLDLTQANFKREKHQKSCVTFVKSIIEQMQLDFINTITVYGEKQKNNLFAWTKEVSLKSQENSSKKEQEIPELEENIEQGDTSLNRALSKQPIKSKNLDLLYSIAPKIKQLNRVKQLKLVWKISRIQLRIKKFIKAVVIVAKLDLR